MSKTYYVYIMASRKNGFIYIGSTSNLIERVHKHKRGLIEGYSAKHLTTILVYFEETTSPEAMVARERQLKHWKRDWKIQLIERDNPNWEDITLE
jgi:putative endonuclease